MLQSKSDKLILDGWSLDVFKGKKRVGVGIAKDIIKSDLFEFDAGLYITKDFFNLFNKKYKPDLGIGFSLSRRI